MTTNPHATCQRDGCAHAQDEHSRLSGCLALAGNTASLCYCPSFVAPPQETGAAIPARNTDPETSHKATRAILVRAGSQRTRLLAGFAAFGEDGATDEEAMEAAEGVSPLSEYAKRASELREGGYVEVCLYAGTSSQVTRKGGSGLDRIVSRITEKGTAALAGAGTAPNARPPKRDRRPITLTPAEADALRRMASRLASGGPGGTHEVHSLGVTFVDDLRLVTAALEARAREAAPRDTGVLR
jgi:hypothetical protein